MLNNSYALSKCTYPPLANLRLSGTNVAFTLVIKKQATLPCYTFYESCGCPNLVISRRKSEMVTPNSGKGKGQKEDCFFRMFQDGVDVGEITQRKRDVSYSCFALPFFSPLLRKIRYLKSKTISLFV